MATKSEGGSYVMLRGVAPRARKASTRIPEGNPRAEPPCSCYPHPRRRAGVACATHFWIKGMQKES